MALLVTSATSLTAAERTWVDDITLRLGNVDPVAYGQATAERLGRYLVVFVIDDSRELDVAALRQISATGATIHLIGNAARHAAAVNPKGPQ